MKKHTITLNQDQIEYLNDLLLAEAETREPSEDNYNIGDHDFNDLFYRAFLGSFVGGWSPGKGIVRH